MGLEQLQLNSLGCGRLAVSLKRERENMGEVGGGEFSCTARFVYIHKGGGGIEGGEWKEEKRWGIRGVGG